MPEAHAIASLHGVICEVLDRVDGFMTNDGGCLMVHRGETGNAKPWTFWCVSTSKFDHKLELTQRTIVLVIHNRWLNETYTGGHVVKEPLPIEHIPPFHLGSHNDIISGDIF